MTVHDEIFGEWEARVASRGQEMQRGKQRSRVAKPREVFPDSTNSGLRIVRFGCIALILVVGLSRGLLWYQGMYPPQLPVAAATPVALAPRVKLISEIQLGERVAGVNPVREEAEFEEPDAQTWRAVHFEMRKPSGRLLQIELLRPDAWFEENHATVGAAIDVNLEEMGAVGLATITAIGPCPSISPGTGAVVTGRFIHEADEQNSVIRLKLQGQSETTRVTANHLYWSEDRSEFVPAGELHCGELVNTSTGSAQVESIESDPDFHGFLYNLETTEHVYRVGSLGALVHNNCWIDFQKGTKGLYATRTDAAAAYRNLRASAYAPYKGPYSHVGHSFTKHAGGQRPASSAFPKLAGNDAAKEATARGIFESILKDPKKSITVVPHAKYGQVIEVMSSSGMGAKFGTKGDFLYFFE
jgi:hypothetical protein